VGWSAGLRAGNGDDYLLLRLCWHDEPATAISEGKRKRKHSDARVGSTFGASVARFGE
jgi:hypothetical protein